MSKGRAFVGNHDRVVWPSVAMAVALVLFLSTVQVHVNGSRHGYTTDVGEIQNALPRWGLIHHSGYPLYTLMGSLFVTVLRLPGIEPAAGASLFSVLWGMVTVGLLVVLAQELDVSGSLAALGALAPAVAVSFWVDASIAEVHTLTLAFTVATLLLAVRFGRSGRRRDLLLLTLALTQGLAHQRTIVLLLPAVGVLVWPHLRTLWRHLGSVLAVSLLAPLIYLYMPLRVWMGATWVFGSPGTWQGFWEMVLDNRADRVVRAAESAGVWLMRAQVTLQIMADDLPWVLIVLGLAGLGVLALHRRRRESLGLMLAWLPNLVLTVAIWKDRVGDAQLAAKLPILVLAGVGLALLLEGVRRRSSIAGAVAACTLLLALAGWTYRARPFVLAITRDPRGKAVIATAERLVPPDDGRESTLMALWGHDYWALAYAKECQGRFPNVGVVDHNANFGSIVEGGNHLYALDGTFGVLPVSWWEGRLGRVYLSSAAPGVVEISTAPTIDVPNDQGQQPFDPGNGIVVRSAHLTRDRDPQQVLLTLYWEAARMVDEDYSVAVHLVARDPPQGGADVLAQADSVHPVAGWYPTSRWTPGEIVRDVYLLSVPPDAMPVAVRVGMYRVDDGGAFVNSEWLSLPMPE